MYKIHENQFKHTAAEVTLGAILTSAWNAQNPDLGLNENVNYSQHSH